MPAIITNKFRIHNSEQFSESFSEASPNVYYLGIGRPQAFATQTRGDLRTDNQGTDVAPLTPVDSVQEEFYTFDDLLAAKKIAISDVSFVIPRRNWTTSTVYDYYRHDYSRSNPAKISGATNLYSSTYYVINQDYQVCICSP